jgi:hypothetical protein
MMKTKFWERRKFFDSYASRANEQLAKLPPKGVRVSCPCCACPTMFGDTGEICDLCSWEGFEHDDHNAEEIIPGPNGNYSLTEGRFNFERYLTHYRPEDESHFRESEREKQLKQKMISAFETMMDEPSVEELNHLWQTITECEQSLYQELKRGIFGELFAPTPCSYCEGLLRTSRAKQCPKCGRDWHNPDNITRLNIKSL